MTIFLVSIAFAVAAGLDLWPKIKTRKIREAVITGALMLAAYVILIMVDMDVRPPSPWRPLVELGDVFFE